MGVIAEAILGFMLTTNLAGSSPYSFQPLTECGTNSLEPACTLAPSCDNEHDFRCKLPRWSAARGAWVRVEDRAHAEVRWRGIAEAFERNAIRLVSCQDADGSVFEDCELAGWPRGTGQDRMLAMAAATAAYHESGWREDVQFGYAPAGRGPGGEGCIMQVMPAQLPQFATWLSKKDRQRAWKPEELEALVQGTLGDSPEALDRCISVGMRILSRARQACRGKGVAWDYGMYAMYGTGKSCSSAGASVGDFAAKRSASLQKMRHFKPVVPGEKRIPQIGDRNHARR